MEVQTVNMGSYFRRGTRPTPVFRFPSKDSLRSSETDGRTNLAASVHQTLEELNELGAGRRWNVGIALTGRGAARSFVIYLLQHLHGLITVGNW